MLEGICPKCGKHHYGWILKLAEHQICNSCNSSLEIAEEGSTFPGFSSSPPWLSGRISADSTVRADDKNRSVWDILIDGLR